LEELQRDTDDEESEVDVLRGQLAESQRRLAEAQERERNQLGLTIMLRRCKEAARRQEGEWRGRCAALEEENRRLKEEAAAEAAHKSEALGRFEELQRRLSDATAEVEGMEPNMEELEAMALEFAQIGRLGSPISALAWCMPDSVGTSACGNLDGPGGWAPASCGWGRRRGLGGGRGDDLSTRELAGAIGPPQTAVSCWSRWVLVGSSPVMPQPVVLGSFVTDAAQDLVSSSA
jgi:hypothetical protein